LAEKNFPDVKKFQLVSAAMLQKVPQELACPIATMASSFITSFTYPPSEVSALIQTYREKGYNIQFGGYTSLKDLSGVEEVWSKVAKNLCDTRLAENLTVDKSVNTIRDFMAHFGVDKNAFGIGFESSVGVCHSWFDSNDIYKVDVFDEAAFFDVRENIRILKFAGVETSLSGQYGSLNIKGSAIEKLAGKVVQWNLEYITKCAFEVVGSDENNHKFKAKDASSIKPLKNLPIEYEIQGNDKKLLIIPKTSVEALQNKAAEMKKVESNLLSVFKCEFDVRLNDKDYKATAKDKDVYKKVKEKAIVGVALNEKSVFGTQSIIISENGVENLSKKATVAKREALQKRPATQFAPNNTNSPRINNNSQNEGKSGAL
jgi:hypothetical protein